MFKKVGAGLVLVAAVTLGLSGGGARVDAGGGCHQIASGFTDARAEAVSIEACKFVPAVVRIDAGDAITWKQNDDLPHMVAGVAQSWGGAGEYLKGDSVAYTFKAPGIYPYYCELHPGMVGTVVVGEAPSPSTESGAGALAVSEVEKLRAAPEPVALSQDDQSDGFGVSAFLVVGIAIALIAVAMMLGGLRLAGRLPKA